MKFSIQVPMAGGALFELCQVQGLMELWAVMEALLNEGATGCQQITVIRLA